MKLTLLATTLLASVAGAEVLALYTFDEAAAAVSTDTSTYSTASGITARDGSAGITDYVRTVGTDRGIYFRAADSGTHVGMTSASIDLAGDDYFEFRVIIGGLATGETLDLTSLAYDALGASAFAGSEMGLYSDLLGYDLSNQIDYVDVAALTDATRTAQDADLSTYSEFSGLTNGAVAYFRFYQADGGSTSSGRFNMIDNVTLNGTINSVTVVPEPTSAALLGLGGLALIARRKR